MKIERQGVPVVSLRKDQGTGACTLPCIYINVWNTYQYRINDIGSLKKRNRIVTNTRGIAIQERTFYENGTGYQRPDRRAHYLDDKNGGL
jgi:hypothetical protein